jgi:phage tail sheath protein FI
LWRGAVALTPVIAADRRLALQLAQVNLVRQEPRGFLTLCADTLSADDDFRPIHVRRLLILLRRLALKLGADYVFEPNGDAFRRLVQRNFDALLEDLFRRGAFAGATAATSFQVVTGDSLNTPSGVDQGRFIVELRVAPAQALTFVTLRLVQTGNGDLSVAEG